MYLLLLPMLCDDQNKMVTTLQNESLLLVVVELYKYLYGWCVSVIF